MRRKPRLDGATPEERERIERFLEWRRVEGREPRWFDWRAAASLAGVIVLTVVGVTLVVSLPEHLREARRRLPPPPPAASESVAARPVDRAPAATVAAPAVETPQVAPPELPERSEPPSDSVSVAIVPPRRRTPAVTTPRTPPPISSSAMPSLMPTLPDEAVRPEEARRVAAPPASSLADAPSSVTPDPLWVPAATPPAPSVAPAEPLTSIPAATAPSASAVPSPPSARAVVAARVPTTAPAAPPVVSPPAPAPMTSKPAPPPAPVPMPDVPTKPLPQPIETVKRLIERLPEVRMGRALVRWVRSQPAPDEHAEFPEPPPRQTQTR